MTSKVIDAINQADVNSKNTTNTNAAHHESNLCGYDSFLHATICTNAKNAVHLSSSPMVITGPNRLTHQHKNRIRTKHHTNVIPSFHQISHQQQPISRETAPMKLSTSLLNQLNPNLSAEQKINRSINHVELWLETKDIRGHQGNELKLMKNSLDNATSDTKCLNNNASQININNNSQAKSQKSINIENRKSLNATEFTETLKITEDEIVSPKKTFNKEVLVSSATRKQIKTHHNNDLLVENTIISHDNQRSLADTKNFVLEYSSIPIAADPSECENLLLKQEADILEALQINPGTDNATGSTTTSNTTTSTVHRYVHIHHHYHHFDAEEED